MADFAVTGASQFYTLSKSLKAAGETGLRKELNKSLQVAAKPLIAITREAAREKLPKRGGLNERVAKAPQRVLVQTGASTYGVRLRAGKRRSGARSTDFGYVRHPVFFHPPKKLIWKTQEIPAAAGWFTQTLEHSAPMVLPYIEKALNTVRDKVEGGIV